MKKNNLDLIEDSVKVIILPASNGFTAAMIDSVKGNISNERYELIITLARGLIDIARREPDKVFSRGMRAFAKDREERKRKEKPTKKIIDFLDYLTIKRKREIN